MKSFSVSSIEFISDPRIYNHVIFIFSQSKLDRMQTSASGRSKRKLSRRRLIWKLLFIIQISSSVITQLWGSL